MRYNIYLTYHISCLVKIEWFTASFSCSILVHCLDNVPKTLWTSLSDCSWVNVTDFLFSRRIPWIKVSKTGVLLILLGTGTVTSCIYVIMYLCIYNFLQNIVEKYKKLSNIDFFIECFTADFVAFLQHSYQNLSFQWQTGHMLIYRFEAFQGFPWNLLTVWNFLIF